MKYAIFASLAVLVFLAACGPAMKKDMEAPVKLEITMPKTDMQQDKMPEMPQTQIVMEKEVMETTVIDNGDIEVVTTEVEQMSSDMDFSELDELDAQLAELDKLELG